MKNIALIAVASLGLFGCADAHEDVDQESAAVGAAGPACRQGVLFELNDSELERAAVETLAPQFVSVMAGGVVRVQVPKLLTINENPYVMRDVRVFGAADFEVRARDGKVEVSLVFDGRNPVAGTPAGAQAKALYEAMTGAPETFADGVLKRTSSNGALSCERQSPGFFERYICRIVAYGGSGDLYMKSHSVTECD